MDDSEHIGANLARNLISLRRGRKLTQDALAAAAALPRSTIANLESGEANPSLAVLVKVAGALGVPIDELLGAPRAKMRNGRPRTSARASAGGGLPSAPWYPSRCRKR